MRWLLVALALLCAAPLHAAEGMWIEAQGFAIQSGAEDAASAKRRAVADALLMAALSGGANVQGHTAMDKSVITADMLIVRPVGRVLEHRVVSMQKNGDTWNVVLQAFVGLGPQGDCQSRRNLIVTAYAPQIRVSPNAPAWTEPLAQEVANELIEQLDRHRATELVRVTHRGIPTQSTTREALDYETITRGSVRMTEGEHGFIPIIDIDVGGMGASPELTLDLEMVLIGAAGEETRQHVTRTVHLPGVSPLGQLARLAQPNRRQMAAKLTQGLNDEMTALLNVETCKPVLAHLDVAGGRITAPVGRRQGLTRGAIAFTADADYSTEMLEVVSLSANSVTLKPLDPDSASRSFAGRPVRFMESGM